MNKLYPKKANLFSILFFLVCPLLLFAQPINDECTNAILLDNIIDYCSGVEEFTNIAATHDENMPVTSCVDENDKDVWFRFTPNRPNISINIIGRTGGNLPAGTLSNPAVELLVAIDGDCQEELDLVDCTSDDNNSGTATINKGGLIPGTEYFIRVQGANNRSGTFRLCINNFTPPFPPESDCATSHLLCDKSSFPVEKITGAGDDPNEAAGTCLDCQPGTNTESSSTWYKWIARNNGSLTFTLTPDNPDDDLDFALYELPNGLNDCSGKILLRCMASGENLGQPIEQWRNCIGPTGLMIGDGDMEEACGCQNGDNNFADAINMEEGRVYALLINNFSESDDGFTISFGGTGEFVGPTPNAEIVANDGGFCAGTSISLSGASSSFQLGDITDYTWSFGSGATPSTSTGVGPHTVVYDTPGEKNVFLTVETDLGCIASDLEEAIVVIEPCCEERNGITADGETTDVVCLGSRGEIDVSATSISPILTYEWSNNETTEDIDNLPPDDYQITITNLATCEEVVSFTVDSVAPFEIITDIVMPTCDGGVDGAINLNITGDAEPILVDFGQGFDNSFTLEDLSIGTYPATVQDTNGCTENLMIEVNELQLELDTGLITNQSPTCFGFSNGRLAVSITNGQPGYEYDWNDGNGFVPNNNLNNIPIGNYQLNVIDANRCRGMFEFTVDQPEALSLIIDTTNISCAGETDGMVTTIVEGGTGDYQYQWSNNQTGEQIINLVAGNYSVVVRDENDCQISGAAEIIEPSLISLAIADVQNAICFGDNTGSISVDATGGNGDFEYSIDGTNFQSSATLTALPAGDYTITIVDPRGCTETINASVTQPEPLVVDAGEDQTIDLGFSTDIQAVTGPFGRPVEFSWSNPDALDCVDCPNPVAAPVRTTTFAITIIDETNCTATDSLTVFVNLIRPLFIPNVFSPNSDGNNDRFSIFGGVAAAQINELQVYDRWGNLVYDGKNLPINSLQTGWDGFFNGQELQPGVYAFVAQILFIDDFVETVSGDVTLVK